MLITERVYYLAYSNIIKVDIGGEACRATCLQLLSSPDHLKTGLFKILMFLSWFLNVFWQKWKPIVRFQIPFEIWSICKPTSFWPFKVWTHPVFRSLYHWISLKNNWVLFLSFFIKFSLWRHNILKILSIHIFGIYFVLQTRKLGKNTLKWITQTVANISNK